MISSIGFSAVLAVRINRFQERPKTHGYPIVKIVRRIKTSSALTAKKPAPGAIGAGFEIVEFAQPMTQANGTTAIISARAPLANAPKGSKTMARKANSAGSDGPHDAASIEERTSSTVERVSLSNQPVSPPLDGFGLFSTERLTRGEGPPQVVAKSVEAQPNPKPGPISLPPEQAEPAPNPPPALDQPAEPAASKSSFFSPERTRLSMGYSVFGGEAAGVKGEALILKVQRPEKDRFFRACSDEGYSVCLPAITYRPEKDSMREELYITTMELVESVFLYDQAVSSCLTFLQITLCQELNGPFFLWPLKLGKEGRARWSDVTKNQVKALELAMGRFIRLTWNGRLHEVIEHRVNPAPQPWPSKPMEELLEMGFDAANIVTDEAHEVVKKLRGEV